VQAAADACAANGTAECGIYTGPGFWRGSMANTSRFADLALWYAWYNHATSLDSWTAEHFGGWSFPAAKQWAEEALCGVGVDKDTMQAITAPSVIVDRTPPPAPTAPPPAPTGLFPASGTTVSTSYAKLMAASIPYATSWQHAIESWDAAGQRWAPYYTWTATVPFRKISPAWANRYYRLRVRASNAYGWGAWSVWSTFAFGHPTGAAPPDAPPPPPPSGDGVPTNLAPDGGTLASASVTMSWSAGTGADAYEVGIEYLSGTTWRTYTTYAASTTSKTFWPQYHATSYRFRVRARTAGAWSPWSAWAQFAWT